MNELEPGGAGVVLLVLAIAVDVLLIWFVIG